MRLRIIAVGRLKSGPERSLFDDYATRLANQGRGIGLDWQGGVEIDESRARAPEQRKREEAAAIRGKLTGSDTRLVVLDERGQSLASERFAKRIGAWRDDGAAETVFIVGGPDGVDAALVAEADLSLALGTMTWPHRLARVLLAEQLYRAAAILSGHPYHRA